VSVQLHQEAKQALLDMAEESLAFVAFEAQARAADELWRDRHRPIDPHVLGQAREALISENRLRSDRAVTRGGRSITVYQPANLSGRERAALDAAARKRLIYSRYLGWAQGSTGEQGIIGAAAERVLHDNLRHAAGAVGYRLENFARGQAATVLGIPVPGGPLDNAAHLYIGAVGRRYTLLFESKSRREWTYHQSQSLYQVLYKAAVLHARLPGALIVPVYVCRRAHITAFRLAKDVGAYIIELRRQWVPRRSRITDKALNEVRAELSFIDLVPEPENRVYTTLERHLTIHLPLVVERQAERWQAASSQFAYQYQALWQHGDRTRLAEIRNAMSMENWFEGGW
jgi:hypothetical protein